MTQLYEKARDLLKQFNLDSGFAHDQASRAEFHTRLVRDAQTQGVPELDDDARVADFLLPKILQDATDLKVMQRVTGWLQNRG